MTAKSGVRTGPIYPGAIVADSKSLDAAKRAAVLTVVGNSLEWFDFATYAFFASIIARQFFPTGDPTSALIQTLAVFGIGLLARPLGAVFFGRLGDIKGRRFALLIAMPIMGVSTLLLGLMPNYAMVGSAASILLVICRLAQGFSAGGEVGNAITFLIEWSPPNRRAFYSGLQQASSTGGTLVGSLFAAYLASVLDGASLESWGWRIPFVFGGLVIAPFGYYLRSKAQETPQFGESKLHGNDVHTSGSRPSAVRLCTKVVGLTMVWVVNFYVFLIYVPMYLTRVGHLTQASALWINSLGLLTEVIFILLSGIIADRVGRKPLYLVATLGVLFLSYPMFLLFENSASLTLIAASIVVIGVIAGIFAGTGPAIMAEIFPTHLRTTGVSIGYGISAGLFGGFASLISEMLIKATGSPVAPSLFAIAAAAISLAFVINLDETAHKPLA